MPKEKVYDTSELFDVEVGWSLDREVQLGIATHDGQSIADWLRGREFTHESAAETGGYESLPLPSFSSLWASLDRRQINRLIKMLRKARDEAYGRDE